MTELKKDSYLINLLLALIHVSGNILEGEEGSEFVEEDQMENEEEGELQMIVEETELDEPEECSMQDTVILE